MFLKTDTVARPGARALQCTLIIYQIGCNMCLTLVWASSYNLYGSCVVITEL